MSILFLMMGTSIFLAIVLLLLVSLLSTRTTSKVTEDLKRIKRQIEY